MGTLSNFGFLRGLWGSDHNAQVEVRPARDLEIDPAVRLIAAPHGHIADPQVREFTRLALAHRQDAGGVWVAQQNGKLISAVLPVASPGRTMLIFPPAQVPDDFHGQLLCRMVDQICSRAAADGIHLVQALIDAQQARVYSALQACSFRRLAELLYLQSAVPRNLRPPLLPRHWRWQTYTPSACEAFGCAILQTYQQSLDCPGLNGLRDINDVLAGHRATGEFDPNFWFMLWEHDEPLGVLLLSPVTPADMIELVYLGVAPAHRGRGVGDILMRQAAARVSASRHTRLSLAVDAGNLPALKLYWRHGLQAIGRKVAMLRDLRAVPAT